MRAKHHQWLKELTGLPTAAGREGRVVAWVRAWAARRRVVVEADRFGNIFLHRRGTARRAAAPIFFTAHLDHPAFVVAEVLGAREVTADFRGHVLERFFVGSPVLLHGDDGRPARGRVVEYHRPTGPWLDGRARVVFARKVAARPAIS